MPQSSSRAAQRLALSLALSLAAAGASAAELGEGPVRGVSLPGSAIVEPAAPALVAPVNAIPSAALPPALAAPITPYLSQPSHLSPAARAAAAPSQAPLPAGSPSADPHAAAAPRPAGAAAGLQSAVRALDQERAAETAPGAQEAQPAASAASRAFFDGALGKAGRAGAVVAAAAVPGGVALPAAYALARYAGERAKRPAPEPAPLAERLGEQAHTHLAFVAMTFPAMLAHGLVSNGTVLTLIAALLAFGTSAGMEQMLAQARNRVVGGWQASHDQKYRVDPGTGRIKDVRGHKYGDDRYDERAPGPVSAGEKLWFRLVSLGAGALLVSAWSGASLALYGAALTAAWLAADLLESRRPAAERVYTDEDRAHAARFRH